jgi:hypothetical protein
MADALGKFIIPPSLYFGPPYSLCLNSSFTGSIHKIDSSITDYQQLLAMLSRSDPRRPLFLFGLALDQLDRHMLSNQREVLDDSISHFAESILLIPHSWFQRGPLILKALFFLARALFVRSREFKQPEDAIYVAKYLSHLRDQPQEILTISRHKVTKLLVDALALQVELDAGNVMQNIREMAVLSRELFTLETSDFDPTHLIILIHRVVVSNISTRVPDQPLDELIECLRAARKHRPDLLEGRIAFAMSLVHRYLMSSANDDYDEAASILDEIIAYCSSGNSQDESVSVAQGFATVYATLLARTRSATYRTPEYLEEAIYRARACFSSSSFKQHYSSVVLSPEATAEKRFRYFGSIEGVEESSGHSPYSMPVPEVCDIGPTVDRMKVLLSGIQVNNDDTTKIDSAVEEGRSILASSPHASILLLFGGILYAAFWRTKKIEYLNESISVSRQEIETTNSQVQRLMTFASLALSLLARSHCFPDYRTQDLDEGLELLSQYVSNAPGNFLSRLGHACTWAHTARRTRHTSVSAAYETALSLMQDTVLFSPTLQLQHSTLAVNKDTHRMPLDYASYQVDLQRLEQAVETLERGRALLWSEMRHLRASTNQLLEADPDLAHKFAAVNQDLEELTKSVPPSHKLSMDDGAAEGLRAVDPFGRLVLKQRDLLKERAKLISEIQALPGFGTFLESPSFDTIRSAASSGPVIIINHSKWRSDILVILHNMPPSLIPTPSDFYLRTSVLKDKLLDSRLKFGLDSSDYEETLADALKELYEVVGKPVIDRLRQLQVPEQSRIWLCPTSVLCSLPLHAMGPIPSDDGELRYFLDLYICSYTPTLSALIQSRYRDSGFRSEDRPSIQLVAQPDQSIPTVEEEIQVVQALDTEVSSLISEAATPAAAIDGFHHHRFVHIACHGTLEAGKPFEAGFELHANARLTLLEIVRAHLPAAEFAFLSACHTAEVTEGSIMDEGLHLAAAVQYCGFRSVVGTMWAMADIDGRDLANFFYKALFSDSREIPYHERSAKALHFAVKKLRRKRGISLERWVNFVHYGA